MSEQSTFKFLLSKEGRGILIGTIILLAVVGVVGIYTFNALFATPEQSSSAQQAKNTSKTAVKASRKDIRANVTSQNMNQEAREVLDEYNDEADSFGLMPVPTPDDVEFIDTAEDTSSEPSGLTPSERARDAREIEAKTNSGAGNVRLTEREREALNKTLAARHKAIREYRNSRLDAARNLLAVYNAPPSNASMAIKPNETNAAGPGSNKTKPATVKRNADGTTSFVGERQGGQAQCPSPLIKGGEIRYAQTDIALNTDFQGPIRMTFLDGAIKGWVGMGAFELNELGARMKLTINRLIDPDGQTYSASGYVLDPDTTLWAMASDVDRHIIYRYGGFGLGVILSAFGELADQREVSRQTINANGASSTQYREPDGKQVTWRLLGEFSRLFEKAFTDNINRPITVKLDPNQEAGVLFEDTVCEIESDITKSRKAKEEWSAKGYGDPITSTGQNF